MPINSVSFDASLLETMFRRRTRRFPVGGRLAPRLGGLAVRSEEAPHELSKIETTLLCFFATGMTGATTEEARYLIGPLDDHWKDRRQPLRIPDDAPSPHQRPRSLPLSEPGSRGGLAGKTCEDSLPRRSTPDPGRLSEQP